MQQESCVTTKYRAWKGLLASVAELFQNGNSPRDLALCLCFNTKTLKETGFLSVSSLNSYIELSLIWISSILYKSHWIFLWHTLFPLCTITFSPSAFVSIAISLCFIGVAWRLICAEWEMQKVMNKTNKFAGFLLSLCTALLQYPEKILPPRIHSLHHSVHAHHVTWHRGLWPIPGIQLASFDPVQGLLQQFR